MWKQFRFRDVRWKLSSVTNIVLTETIWIRSRKETIMNVKSYTICIKTCKPLKRISRNWNRNATLFKLVHYGSIEVENNNFFWWSFVWKKKKRKAKGSLWRHVPGLSCVSSAAGSMLLLLPFSFCCCAQLLASCCCCLLVQSCCCCGGGGVLNSLSPEPPPHLGSGSNFQLLELSEKKKLKLHFK